VARDFDGSNDNIGFGSDATIDNFVALTIAFTLKWDGGGAGDVIIGKANGLADGWRVAADSTNVMGCTRDYSTTLGAWNGSTAINASTHHFLISQDGNVLTVPRILVDGVADTVTPASVPAGTLDADAANNLLAGESSSGTNDLDGAIQNLVIHDAVFSAEEENRCRWWGVAPGGPSTVKVWHPFYTTDLVNKGTATATGTATGTTVVGLATNTVRPGSAMMGMGVGW
jgi:hypothetical protein